MKKQFANKISAVPNKRRDPGAGVTTKISKENYAPPERKTNTKQPINKNKPTGGFHSIDLSNQSIEHPSKKYSFI